MQVSDVVAAVPSVVLWGFLPGFALTILLAPGWTRWWGLAAAPGLSAGFAGVVGLLYHRAHVPFTPLHVAPILIVICLGAFLRGRSRTHSVLAVDAMTRTQRLAIVVSALAVGALSCVTLIVAFHNILLPVGNDASFHGTVAADIARHQDAYPPFLSPPDHTTFYRAQMGYEAMVALAANTSGINAAHLLLAMVLPTVMLLPVSIAALAWQATGSWKVSALTPLFSIGLLLLTFPFIFGIYTLLVDSTLVVPSLLGWWRWIERGERPALAMLLASLAAIWVIHGLEAYTVVFLAVPLALSWWSLRQQWRLLLRRAIIAAASVATIIAALVVASHHPAGPSAVDAGLDTGTTVASTRTVPLATALQSLPYAVGLSAPGIIFYLVGVVAAVRHRRLYWLLAFHVLALALVIDRVSLFVFGALWRPLYPWDDPYRLLALQYFCIPIFIAFGLVTFEVHRGARLLPSAGQRRVIVVASVLITAALGTTSASQAYGGTVHDHNITTAADLATIEAMANVLPPGSLVLNDGIDDAGQWVEALTPDQLYIPKVWITYYQNDARVVALLNACNDVGSAVRALRGVQAVYVGARLDAEAKHPWTYGCIATLPEVTLLSEHFDVTTGRTAAVFRVHH